MNTLLRAIEIYRKAGFQVKTSLNPFRFNNYRDAPATIIFESNQSSLPPGGDGIAIAEIYFFESLFQAYQPKTIFGVGNGYGWSSVIFSILNPQAKIKILDCGFLGSDRSDIGIDATNSISKNNNFNLEVVKGSSPDDVDNAIKSNFGEQKIQFVFIDGVHTSDYIVKDFDAVLPFLDENSIVLFHDVLNFNMLPGIESISRKHSFQYTILHRTESGMVAMYKKDPTQDVKMVLESFSEQDWILHEVYQRSHRLHHFQKILPPALFSWSVQTIIKFKKKLRSK